MADLLLIAFVQAFALGADPQSFDQASQQSLTTGRPLVVLVGARWCPACQRMKNSILPQVARGGGLNQVVFTYVDFDRQRQLASRLTREGPIPQLIRLDRAPSAGWSSKRLVGARSPRDVYEFINAGLAEEGVASRVAAAGGPGNDPGKSARAEPAHSTPDGSQPEIGSSARAAQPPQAEADDSPVKKAGRSSQWMLLFHTFFPESGDWPDIAGPEQDRSRQASEGRGSGATTKQREVRGDDSESGGAGPDIGGSPSRLVRGSTVSRRNSRTSDLQERQE